MINWEETRLKSVVSLSSKTLASLTSKQKFIPLEDIEKYNGKFKILDKDLDSSNNEFKSGDVCLNKLRPYLTKVIHPNFDGACSSEMMVLTPKKDIYSKYLFYYCLNSWFIDQMSIGVDGVKMPRAKPTDVLRILFTKPSIQEQTAIANYLDEKTASISGSIETLRRKKELLIEQKKTIIHKAVTQGLDDSVPMKDSGVEWIGMVPEHWVVDRIKNKFCYLSLSKAPENSKKYIEIGDVNVFNNTYNVDEKDKLSVSGAKLAPENALLISTVRPNRGGITITKEEQPISSAFCVFKISNKFLFYLVKDVHFLKELTKGSMDTTYPTCKDKDIYNQVVGIPQEDEQQQIVDFLDKKTSKIDEAVEEVDKQIKLLEEYKKTLINDVVTGKKRVY